MGGALALGLAFAVAYFGLSRLLRGRFGFPVARREALRATLIATVVFVALVLLLESGGAG